MSTLADPPSPQLPESGHALVRIFRLLNPEDRLVAAILLAFAAIVYALLRAEDAVSSDVVLTVLVLFTLLALVLRRRLDVPAMVIAAVLLGVMVMVNIPRMGQGGIRTIDPHPAWSITGNVFSSLGQPVEDVVVQLMGDGTLSTPTDASGFFQLDLDAARRSAYGDSADFIVHMARCDRRQARGSLRAANVMLVVPSPSGAATPVVEWRAPVAAPAAFASFAGYRPQVPDTTYVRISLATVVAEHDGTRGASAWEFTLMTNGDSLRLNRTAYADRQGENVMLTHGYVIARVLPGQRLELKVEGNLSRFIGSREARGRRTFELRELPENRERRISLPVAVPTDPRAGQFTFNFRITRLPPGRRS